MYTRNARSKYLYLEQLLTQSKDSKTSLMAACIPEGMRLLRTLKMSLRGWLPISVEMDYVAIVSLGLMDVSVRM